MATATWELDRTDHRHPAVGCATRPTPRAAAPTRNLRAGAAAPARRPAPLHRLGQRAATRPGRGVQVGRRLAGLALLLIVVAGLVGLLPGGGTADAAGIPEAGVPLVVGPGDTVWGLVAPHAPAGADVGVYVAAVLAANDLDATAVRPGTVVRIP